VDAAADRDVLAEVRHLTAAEDATFTAVRARAEKSVRLPTPEVGALLRWAATLTGARTIVEIGAAGGMSGLWFLRGMDERGVLTSIEHDPHHQNLATSAYADAGVGERVRSILGDPVAVLPRLSDGGYQVCLIQGQPPHYPTYLEHGLRLLKPGGMLIARDVLRRGAEGADALARFHEVLADDDRLVTTVLPVDGGIALSTLRE
jgi:predicted O-methyltransferase YrrM